MLKATVAVFLVAVVYSSEVPIDYSKQEEWGGVCNNAESKKQSPVDVISPETSTEVNAKFVELSKLKYCIIFLLFRNLLHIDVVNLGVYLIKLFKNLLPRLWKGSRCN